MADIHDIIDKCEGMLDTDDQIAAQHQMFEMEIIKFESKTPDIISDTEVSSKIILNTLENIVNNPANFPEDSFGRCHSKSHGSTGGGTGFGKSYSKRC